MAVHTRHPVSAPPAAPVREKTGHLILRGWCVFAIVLGLCGASWSIAFGDVVAGGVGVASGLVTLVLWLVLRPVVQWRRLPWFVVAYLAWAAASIAWSAWPATSALTWLLLAITTMHGVFVAAVLTWRELVAAIASALKWVLGLSILFELFVSVVWGGPMLPGFQRPVAGVEYDPIVYWSRDNLFDGGRIQGIFGNANLLAGVALLAIVVFGIRYAAKAPRRWMLLAWIGLALFLLVRASSATAYVAGAAVLVVLATVLLMRTARRPGERTRYYIAYAVVAVGGALTLFLGRDAIFSALGRSADLTGRERIWQAVLERTAERPVAGWGFATPWLKGEPAFDGWIIDHGETVMQAHNMWIDVSMQLGGIGVTLLALLYLAFIWRAWFFATDRPRWDLRADRPYSPLSLLPTLLAAILLVQGLAESGPLLLWGWMLVAMLGFKIKQAPIIGIGPAEQSLAIERGEPTKQDA